MDPFQIETQAQAPIGTGNEINWGRLQPGEAQIFRDIGGRVARMIASVASRSRVPMWSPSAVWCAADLACSHLQRPFDLRLLRESDDLALIACYMAIAGSINRINGAILNNDAAPIARFQKRE